MKLTAARADVLVWALIYAGLIVACLGVALQRTGAGYGWGVLAAGTAFVLAGVVMIWVRSRLRAPDAPASTTR